MKFLEKFGFLFNRTIGAFAFLGVLILAFILLLVNYEVVSRYLFNQPLAWTLEIVEYSLLYLTFLGAAWLLKEEGHIKMDLVLNRLRPKVRAWLNFFTSIIGLIVCTLVTWYGAWSIWHLYLSGQYYAAYLMPSKCIIIGIVPLGTLLLSIQFIRRTYGMWKATKAFG